MDKHDEKQIEQLKEFRKWFMWFRSLTKEERKEYFKTRWRNNNESH